VTRVGASLAVGGVTYAVTTLADQPATTTVLLSVFIGGLVLVIQYLSEFERRLTASSEQVRASLAGLNAATRLEELLHASPLSSEDVSNLVKDITAIHDLGIFLVSELATAEWNRLARFIGELKTGRTRYAGEDREWLLALTSRARDEIVATSSMSVDDGFWETELGARYVDMQGEAVGRGVRVRRVFLLDDSRPATDVTFQKARATQQQKQIEVRILHVERLTPAQRTLYKDYVLFDQGIYYQVQPPTRRWATDQETAAVTETLLSTRPEEVEFGRNYFEQLWDMAKAREP
jgi:ABC-type multidrug transport system fused ATPase/permease subunit